MKSLLKIRLFGCALFFLFASQLSAATPPLVTVSVSPSVVERESFQPAQFTVNLSAPASRNIEVAFSMSGTARLGADYTLSGNFSNSGKIIIPAGQTSVTVTLRPRTLDARSVRENAAMTLAHDTLSVHTYRLGSPTRANVIITMD